MSSIPEPIGRIVGVSSPDSFIFVSKKENHPPKYEYVSVKSKELVGDKIIEVDVLAQVTGIASKSHTYNEDLDYTALERIYHAGIDDANVLCKARTLGFMTKLGSKELILVPRRAIYPGNPVYLAPDDLVRRFFSYSPEEGLHIGYLVSRPSIPVHIHVNGFRRHVAIIAQTGAGKSYTVGVLIEELLEKGATVIIIDPHADYVFLSRTKDGNRHPYWKRIQVFRNPNSTGRYSEKDIDNVKELVLRFSELDADNVATIAGIPESYTRIREAINRAVERLRNSNVKRDTYTPQDLHGELDNEDNKSYTDAASRAKTYVKRLFKVKVFGDKSTSIKEILKPFNVSIIDLSGLNNASMDYITSWILKEVFNQRSSGDFQWPVFIFIEEAHRFVPAKSNTLSAPIINTIAAEGRKFGIFLTLITQRPSKINSDTLSQCNSQIILRITNPHDQLAVQQASERLGAELMDNLPGLNVGEAIVVGELTRVPVTIKVRERRTKEGGADIDLVKELRKARNQLKNEELFKEEFYIGDSMLSEV